MDDRIQEEGLVLDWFHRKWHKIFMRLDKQKIADSAR